VSEPGKGQNSPPPLAGGGRGKGAPGSSLLSHARALRRDATPAEKRLWQGLRRHQVGGLKFRRQVPLGPYIADFYCASTKLVIEVDGISHINSRSDAIRDAWMARQGIRVVRVANRDVLANLEGTLIAIDEIAALPPPPTPLPQGEGESSSSPTPIHLHV
jgi:very-short-patch-repair endonuclease